MENVREMGYRGVYENGLLSHKKHEDIWPAAEMYVLHGLTISDFTVGIPWFELTLWEMFLKTSNLKAQ